MMSIAHSQNQPRAETVYKYLDIIYALQIYSLSTQYLG